MEATLGVRPEDLRIARDGDAGDLSFDVAVEVVERLGSEILLDVAAGSTSMVASVDPTVTARVHERLRLAINPDRVHFFDHQSEAAI
jgi:multiple sugar transport system ATP-binding protein